MNKGRVILLQSAQTCLVCNEYHPQDNGRLYLLDYQRFANFHRVRMMVEYAKTSIDIDRVLYEGANWPEAIYNSQNPEEVRKHFGL